MSTLAERLGYAPDAKLLIIHCDDFGMCASENVATRDALESGVASSASIMVPCPARDEAIAYARTHPEADIGMHCTLTSEWDTYRWGPVAGMEAVPSLVDPDGFLWKWEEPFAAHADPAEVERELRAQYRVLVDAGVDVTHLDTHMEAVVSTAAYFDIYTGLAREWRIPFMFPRITEAVRGFFDPDYQRVSREAEADLVANGLLVLDRLIMHVGEEQDRGHFYSEAIRDLESGLTQIITHVAQDGPEIRDIACRDGRDEYTYRLGDYAALMDDRVRMAITGNGVHVITWRAVRSALYG